MRERSAPSESTKVGLSSIPASQGNFPKEKIANTGIIYEPWHYRYVGVENAKAIKESGMILEEWLDSQNIVYVYNAE